MSTEKEHVSDIEQQSLPAEKSANLRSSSSNEQNAQNITEKRLDDSLDHDGVQVGSGGKSPENGSLSEKQPGRFKRFYRRYRYVFHLFYWLFFTGYVLKTHWLVIRGRGGKQANPKSVDGLWLALFYIVTTWDGSSRFFSTSASQSG